MLKLITAAVVTALILASVDAQAAPRNPECAPLSKIFRATVQARQKGSSKVDVEKLAVMIEDPSMKQKALGVINRVFTDEVFASAAPATATAFYSATCR